MSLSAVLFDFMVAGLEEYPDTQVFAQAHRGELIGDLEALLAEFFPATPVAEPVVEPVAPPILRSPGSEEELFPTPEDAIERVVEMAEELAALPPPTKRDDQGFAVTTDAPMRSYLADVRVLGTARIPLEAHLTAARALILHSQTQLPREDVIGAVKRLERAVREAGGDPTERKGSGSKTYYSPTGEATEKGGARHRQELKDGTWYAWKAGQPYVDAHLPWRREGSSASDLLWKAGYRKGTHFDWPYSSEARGKVLRVPLQHVAAVARALAPQYPVLAEAWLRNAPVWYPQGAQAPSPVPAPVPSSIPSPAPRPVPAPSPAPGGAPAPRPVPAPSPTPAAPTAPSGPATVDPKSWAARGDRIRMQIPGGPEKGRIVREMGGVNTPVTAGTGPWGPRADRNDDRPAWFAEMETSKLPELIRKLEAAKQTESAAWVRAVTDAAEKQRAETQRIIKEEGDRSAGLGAMRSASSPIAVAAIVLRRFKGLMGGYQPTIDPETADELGEVVEKVKPGTKDFGGANRGWTVSRGVLYIRCKRAPFKWQEKIPGANASVRLMSLHGTEDWTPYFPQKKAALVAAYLDRYDLPLATSLRIALLTEAEPEGCGDLDALAGVSDPAQIRDPRVRGNVETMIAKAGIRWVEQTPERTVVHDLMPFQAVGIAFAHFTGYNCLIADSMGLGKTIQAIGALKLGESQGTPMLPAVVVAPASVTFNWRDELERWLPGVVAEVMESTSGYVGGDVDPGIRRRLEEASRRGVVIVSWGIVANVVQQLTERKIATAILDEAHYAKHPGSQRSRASQALAAAAEHVLPLTGTPMDNKVEEIWPLLHMVSPDLFSKFDAFKAKYGSGSKRVVSTPKGDDPTETEDVIYDVPVRGSREDILDDLKEQLRCVMIRRTKADVDLGLLPKTRYTVDLRLNDAERAIYTETERKMGDYVVARVRSRLADMAARSVLQGQDPVDALTAAASAEVNIQQILDTRVAILNYLRQAAGRAKIPKATAWLMSFLRQGKPLVLFCEHQEVVRGMEDALRRVGARYTVIDGSVSARNRADRIKGFQRGEYDVIIGTKAMREGVTLTRAADVAFVELWYVPTWMEQAEDRTWRKGQTRAVSIYRLVADGTTDPWIEDMLAKKLATIGSVVDQEEIEEEDEDPTAQEKKDTDKERSIASALAEMLNEQLQAILSDARSYRPRRVDLQKALDAYGSEVELWTWHPAADSACRGTIQKDLAGAFGKLGAGRWPVAAVLEAAGAPAESASGFRSALVKLAQRGLVDVATVPLAASLPEDMDDIVETRLRAKGTYTGPTQGFVSSKTTRLPGSPDPGVDYEALILERQEREQENEW